MNMVDDLKEEMNKFFNKIKENTKKHCKEIKTAIEDLKLEIESIK